MEKRATMSKNWSEVSRYFAEKTVVHLATLMPDGSPQSVPVWVGLEGENLSIFSVVGSRNDKNLLDDGRLAISVTAPEQPLDMAFVRGEVVKRLTGEAALEVIDRISHKYTGSPYPRDAEYAAYLVRPRFAWANDYS